MGFNHIANAFNGIEKERMRKENLNLTALAGSLISTARFR